MGLDMYLRGKVVQNKEERYGRPVSSLEIQLAYWRKHPDLHMFIVEDFASGDDNCEPIYLGADALTKILEVIRADKLEHGAEGFFFFGSSPQPDNPDHAEAYRTQKAFDIAAFEDAIVWLKAADPSVWFKAVYYQASW